MRISLTFGGCGHSGTTDIMGKDVEATVEHSRRALEASGECDACREAASTARHAERVRLVEEANRDLPPMQGSGWERFRAMECRAARRQQLDAVNAAYTVRLGQPGLTLRIRCEAKEAKERSVQLLACTNPRAWLGKNF